MTVDIAPLKELAEAATPGPWDTDTVHNEGDVHNAWDAVTKANAAFIISAVAALTTEIETLRAAVHALTVERDEAKVRQVDWQEGCPARPYGEAWFLAVMASGDRVVLRELPEEYAYDFKTADDTYVKRENVNRWAQFPDSEFLFPREKLAAAESALTAARAERDALREVLEGVIAYMKEIGHFCECGESSCRSMKARAALGKATK